MHKYRLLSKKGEGTFSEVLKAQSIRTGKNYAIKCMKNHFDSIDQVNNLREIQALRRLAGHPNIIKLHEVLYDEPTGRLALVFELMDMNLYEAIKGRRHYLPEQKVKQYMYELLKALDHMHRNGIFHRDVKPENLLLLDDEVKLADLGSCRGIYSRQPYTEYISTRWYRAPECLLTDGFYNFKMDLFAGGCVWFEIVALFPLFPGQNEMDQIQKIHSVLGTPDQELLTKKFKRNASHMDFNFPEKRGSGIERLIPHADPDLVELMKKLLRYDPDERILARQALKDPLFKDLRDADKERASTGQGQISTERKSVSSTTGASPSQPMPAKADMNATTSTVSVGVRHPETPPEITPEITSNAAGPSHAGPLQVAAAASTTEERSVSLPNLSKDRRMPGAPCPDGSDGEDPEDTPVLPPIGAMKAKRDQGPKGASGQRTLKAAGAATLQKGPSAAALHSAAAQALGSSKGLSGVASHGLTATGFTSSSTGALHSIQTMSSWPSQVPKDACEPVRSALGSPCAPDQAIDKMNSTWHASQSNRTKYVSPFGNSKVARDSGVGKKR